MFMPLSNNCNTRSQMALNIPVCRTIRGQKSMWFLGPNIWNKVSLTIKAAATNFIDFIIDPNGNKNHFGSCLGHPCHLRCRGIFFFSYAFLLFNCFIT